jgi:hypothetical protein
VPSNVRNQVPSNAASNLISSPLHCCENVKDQCVMDNREDYVRFQVLMAATMKKAVIRGVTLSK